jgi:hypothetical protein
VLEREAQLTMGVGVQGKDDDARGVAVDPVDDPEPPAEPALEPLLEAGRARLAPRGDDRLAGRLGRRHEVLVLVKERRGRLGH